MDLSPDLDKYIHESIAHTLGLPVSSKTLELKLAATEEARNHLQNQIFRLEEQLKEKDQKLDGSRVRVSHFLILLLFFVQKIFFFFVLVLL